MDDGFDIGDVDAVTRDFLAIGFDKQTGLAEFADNSELGKAFGLGKNIFDLDGFFLEDIKIGPKDFDGEGTLEA